MEHNGEPGNESCIYDQLMFDKESKNTYWGKEVLFSKLSKKLNSHVHKNEIGSITPP